MNDVAIIRTLRERVEELEEEVRQLRDILAPRCEFPEEWRLTRSEAAMLAIFAGSVSVVTKSTIALARVQAWKSDGYSSNLPAVIICNLRKKLRNTPVQILTVWGIGWQTTPEGREYLRKFLKGPKND